VTEALSGALRDPDPLVVVSALVSLADRPDGSVVPVICELARASHEPLVVEEAVASLGALGDPVGLEVIFELLADAKATLRRRIVAALGGFSGPEVEGALDALAEDRDWQVRQAVSMLRRDG
jgi:HEAT repeat protein